jgi:hypothetical protein
MFKNRIINGAMMIDQRNAGASVSITSNNAYPVDRFLVSAATTTFTVQRSTTAPVGFSNSLLVTNGTGASSSATQFNGFKHEIEGNNVADLNFGTANAQTFTISFWVRSSVTGTYAGRLASVSDVRTYTFTYTINAANTWEQKTVTVAGDTSGTWATDNSRGIQLIWDLGSGSNFNGTAGSWGTSGATRTSGSVNWTATTGATFYITGVQLEKGSTATSFDYRPYGTELALCERYFEQTFFVSLGSAYSSSYPQSTYRVQKRVNPTITFSAAGGAFTPNLNTLGFYQNSQNTNNTAVALTCYSSSEL